MKCHPVAFGAVAILLSGPASAASPLDLISTLMRMPVLGQTMTYEGVIARLSDPIRLYDLDDNGLDGDDIALVAQARMARMRAEAVARFLAYDLNNDREVSREEINRVAQVSTNGGSNVKQIRAQFAAVDLDGNGVLDWNEMGTLPNDGATSGSDRNLQAIVRFDPTPDTPFMLSDAKTLADQLFALADTDKNGVLDQTELVAAQRPVR